MNEPIPQYSISRICNVNLLFQFVLFKITKDSSGYIYVATGETVTDYSFPPRSFSNILGSNTLRSHIWTGGVD